MKSRKMKSRNLMKYSTIMFTLFLLTAAFSAPAWADGTTAGEWIDNQATINYKVAGADQVPIDSVDPTTGGATRFRVDRKVDLTVARQGGYVDVPANAQDRVLTFTVSNTGNAPFYFNLAQTSYAIDPIGGGVAAVTITSFNTYVDSDGSGAIGTYISGDHSYDATDTDTAITTLDPDHMINVYVVCDIPDTATGGQFAAVLLTATAGEPNTGDALTNDGETTAWVQDTMQTLFADGAGESDNEEEADYSAAHAFRIIAAGLSVTKTVEVFNDGISTSDYKAIPGATMEYTITVTNSGADTQTATNIIISDSLAAEIDLGTIAYDAGSISLSLNGAAASPLTDASDGDAGDWNETTANTITVDCGDLAPDDSAVVKYRVVIQ